jgi:hypothetical protein
MEPITIIVGTDLKYFLETVNDVGHIYALRVHQTRDGRVKVKVNQGTWTPGLGTPDNA